MQRRRDGDRTRERILEAALPLFADHGFAGTSTRKVGQAAGVNVATIAYHFQDKAGLYRSVVERLHVDLAQAFPALEGTDPTTMVEGVVRAGWEFAKAHRPHIRLLHRHVLDNRGKHHDVVIDEHTEPLLGKAQQLVAMFRPDWSTVDQRLLIISIQHVVVRLVIEDQDHLRKMTGVVDVDEAVVAWVSAWLRRELGLSRRA